MPFKPMGKRSYRKPMKKTTASKKVKTTPKKDTSVVKLQKQINALNLKINKEKEIKEIDFGILENSVGQVSGQGIGLPPINGIGIAQLSNGVGGLTIAQGVDNAERIGDYVNLKRMKWRLQIQNQIACPTPMRLRLEIWQLIGDPLTLMSPQALLKYVYLPNQFYANATSGSSGGPVSIWDTTSQRNPQYKISNIAKKIFTKHMYVPQEQFGTAIEIREHNFNVDLKNLRTGFTPSNQLQCQYYYFIFANTGNASTSLLVDPNYTNGLGSYGQNTGTRVNANVRLEYLDD